MVKSLNQNSYSVEISENLHRLFWMQIRNWIYYTKQESKISENGVISWYDVFKMFTDLFDWGKGEAIFEIKL